MRWIAHVMAVGLAGLALSSLAKDDGWRLDKEQDAVQVYSRAVPGWSIREIRAVTVIPARLPSLVAVITDPKASGQMSEVVKQTTIRQQDSATRYQVHSILDMPWPVKDRDMLNQRDIRQDPNTGEVTIVDTALKNDAQGGEYVHIERSTQRWTLKPMSEGRVSVELRVLTDPAGPIPASVVNLMAVDGPLQSLKKLRELVQHSEYREAQLSFVRER